MSSKQETTNGLHELLKAMIAGLPNMPPTITAVTVLGTTYTLPDLIAKLAEFESKYANADALALQAKKAADDRDAEAPKAKTFARATKRALKTALGPKSAPLETVGITPEKTPAPLTTEQKQAAVAKAKATRAARHTMGKKQKAKIKGQVPPTPAPGGGA